MSTYYYNLLLPYLNETQPDLANNIYNSLSKFLNFDISEIFKKDTNGRDVLVRIVYTILVSSQFNLTQHEDKAINSLGLILENLDKFNGTTTFALSRILFLLRSLIKEIDNGVTLTAFMKNRFFALPFSSISWLKWILDTKSSIKKLKI